MRFPRQARVFRGQLDVAPVAGVILLLLMFLEMGALIYTPGVLVHLDKTNSASVIHVASDGSFRFGTNIYTEKETNALRNALQQVSAGPQFSLEMDKGVSTTVAARDRAILEDLFAIHLPTGSPNLLGTDNPTVIVVINLNGQYFYENRMMGERELKEELSRRLQEAARESKVLTVTVAGDVQANWSALTGLAEIAREVGVKDIILAAWPEPSPPSSILPNP